MSLPFRLLLISDRNRMGDQPVALVARLVRSGLRAFQWREKDLAPAENRVFLEQLTSLVKTKRCRVFVNDRVDLALALGLDVHLAESSIPTSEARRILPPETLIGRSTHSPDGARRAELEGADFVTFGPVYDTPSKRPFGPPQGTDRLRQACGAVSIPVLALGGVTAANTAECLAAGAQGVALIGAVWGAPDPVRALLDLKAAVGEGTD